MAVSEDINDRMGDNMRMIILITSTDQPTNQTYKVKLVGEKPLPFSSENECRKNLGAN